VGVERSRPRLARLPALHEGLVLLVALAAGLGLALPHAARALRPGVPEMLAAQVAGVGLTISAQQLAPLVRRGGALVVALGIQWTLLPLVGLGLYHLVSGAVGEGAFVTGAAPAEITSALVAVLAGGTAATSAALMTASVGLGCVLTPLWLLLLHGPGVGPGGLVTELLLSVALPLGVSVVLRTRLPALAAHPRRCLDLAGCGLLLVVFVGAGEARGIFLSGRLGLAVACAGVLTLAGAAAGLLAGSIARTTAERLALAYPVGMREFGIATAVAIAVVPRAAGFGGLYGVVMMLAATASAGLLRRAGRAPAAPLSERRDRGTGLQR